MPNSNTLLQSQQYPMSASTYSFDNATSGIGYTINTIEMGVPEYMSINPALHDQLDRIEAKLNKILAYLEIEEKE